MKYMGSKSRFAREIISVILNDCYTSHNGIWIEPFVGGANCIDKVPNHLERFGYDLNKGLITFLKHLENGWRPKYLTKQEYDNLKNSYDFDNPYYGYAGVCCSYSGKWWGGYAGCVNTKQGVRDYQKEAISNIIKQQPNIKGVIFNHCSYENIETPDGCIIYCDPPYAGTTGYLSVDFNHEYFWEWVRRKSLTCNVYVSEYNAPSDFECIWSKEAKSSLSANGNVGGSKGSTEKLFKFNQKEKQ